LGKGRKKIAGIQTSELKNNKKKILIDAEPK
jgi:hypothetical protein